MAAALERGQAVGAPPLSKEEVGKTAQRWLAQITQAFNAAVAAAPASAAAPVQTICRYTALEVPRCFRRVDRTRTRVAPFAGGFAGAGSATGSEAAASFSLAYVTLSYLGVEIGQWVTDEPKSGVTFGWGPAGSGALAFADRQGRLTLMDKERRVRPIARTDRVLLPAWSPDGNYVAYLEQQGRSKFRLTSIALLRVDTPLQ